ncbi:unnamed protein product [Mytilus coruscus]|uniref:Reverse transcriptase domain-containing protein n=1 Tax=Mytilus coruscus TaxID=42192 RepID=A0A6J8EFZ5_MYTCO|nr:unnamed protein product [Mytilus coruscus]
MDKLRATDKFNLDARNLADAGKKWKEDLNLYIDLTRLEIILRVEKCLKISRAAELSKERIKSLENPSASDLEVHSIKQKNRYQNIHKDKIHIKQNRHMHNICQSANIVAESMNLTNQKVPPLGRSAENEGKVNHFESISKSEHKTVQRRHKGHSEESEDGNEYFEINTVSLNNVNTVKEKNSRHILASMNIISKNRKTKVTKFQQDSEAICNSITAKTLKEVEIKQLQNTSQILAMYKNTTIKLIGKCVLKLVNPKENDKFKAEFELVKDGTLTPLLGSKAVQAMSLVTVKYENMKAVRQCAHSKLLSKEIVLKEYSDIFEGTGKLQGKYHLELDKNVHTPRKVPVAMKHKFHSELEWLTKFRRQIVTGVKPDKLRICIEPKHLNQHLKRSQYPLPTIGDLLPELIKVRVISVVDAKNGFWHVELDDDSSLLTIFNTSFGRYRWLRMLFGLSSAPEEYLRRQYQNIEGLPGVRSNSIIDDIQIFHFFISLFTVCTTCSTFLLL